MCLFNLIFSQNNNIDKVIDSCVQNDNFNGAVLLAKNGHIDLLKYTGLSNRHYNIKFSDDTKFHIFSLTKTFTAVLIMQLVDRGKLNLDSTISIYLPEYKGEGASKITVRNLLTYSSGREHKDLSTPDLIHEAYDNTIWDQNDFIKRFLSEGLKDQPGTKFSYNNGDYILLGKILEKIYGRSFERILNDQILIPLKMKNTGFLHHDDIVKNIDEGYTAVPDKPFDLYMPTNTYIDNLYSAGAMYSTPRDLLIFDEAIFNHILFKKSTLDIMMTPYKDLGNTAFSFWVYPKKIGSVDTIFAERQGEGYGHSANWVHLLDRNVSLIILSNTKDINYLNKMRLKILSAFYRSK